MGAALAEAEQALAHGDVPVGAVALVDGEIVASGTTSVSCGGTRPLTPSCWWWPTPQPPSAPGGSTP